MVRVKGKALIIMLAGLFFLAGCSKTVIREYVKPSREKGQYLNLKRVAVLPFDNFSTTKDSEKTIESLLIPALADEEVFDDIVDPRFVRDAMKRLKIPSTDILSIEQVRKLGDELGVQGVIMGKVVSFGKGEDKESFSQSSLEITLVGTTSGSVLWTGNVTASGGLTVGYVFGVTSGETDVQVARKAVADLADDMADSIEDAREDEAKGAIAELKKKRHAEEEKLEALKKETKDLEEKKRKADEEAEMIRKKASEEADEIKVDAEMQKAAIESERSQLEAEKEALEKEKLELQSERSVVDEEKGNLDQVKGEIEALEKEKARLEEEIAKEKEKIQEESVSDDSGNKAEEKLQEEKENLQEQVEEKEGELKAIEKQIEETEKQGQ